MEDENVNNEIDFAFDNLPYSNLYQFHKTTNSITKKMSLKSFVPTVVILITIVTCYYARLYNFGNFNELIDTVPRSLMSPFLHTDQEHLSQNVIAYALLSIPIICILPWIIQPATFILCSITGIITHNYNNPGVALEGVSATPCGLMIVSPYGIYVFAVKSNPQCKSLYTFLFILCCLIVLVVILYFFLKPDLENDYISDAAHLGGVIGGVIVSLTFHCLNHLFL